VTTAKGVTFASQEAGTGDLALQVQSLERDGAQTIVLATVRGHLVAAGADPRDELLLEIQFEAGFRPAQ
jgi:hypothetical protein